MWTQSINLRKITGLKNQRQSDQLIIEKQTNVYLNNEFITELTHTPQFEKELVLGYLIVTGKIGFKYTSIKVEDNNVFVEAPKHTCLPIINESIIKKTIPRIKHEGRIDYLKKGKIHDDHREEIEIKFEKEQFNQLEKLFLALDMNVDIKWFRTRHTFKWQEINVMID